MKPSQCCEPQKLNANCCWLDTAGYWLMRQVWRKAEPTQELLIKPLTLQSCESDTLVIRARSNWLLPTCELRVSSRLNYWNEINNCGDRTQSLKLWFQCGKTQRPPVACVVDRNLNQADGLRGSCSDHTAKQLRLNSLYLLPDQVSVLLLPNFISVSSVRSFLKMWPQPLTSGWFKEKDTDSSATSLWGRRNRIRCGKY